MGLVDRAKAIGLDARDHVADATHAVGDRVEDRFGADRYAKIRKRLGAPAGKLPGHYAGVRDGALDRAGRTAAGRKIGDTSRSAVSEFQALPVLSLTYETLRARQGVPQLTKRLRADPSRPEHALWLAEALLRTEREARAVRTARALVNPSSVLVRSVARTATQLGREEREPANQRLLRLAFHGAATRIRVDPGDANALHVAARVYLARGMLDDAHRLALLAAEADPDSGEPFVTAAFAQLRKGDEEAAAKLADVAVERGCTVSHEVTAELLRRRLGRDESVTARDRNTAFARELGKTRRRDRRAYYGVGLGTTAAAWAVLSTETRKTTTLVRRVGGAMRGGSNDAA